MPSPSPTVEPSTPSAVIDRVSLVLDAFDGPGRLTLAQVVRRTGLPRSSAHRMLDRLVQLRWLRRNGRDYELGMRLVELGSLAVHQDRLHKAAALAREECTMLLDLFDTPSQFLCCGGCCCIAVVGCTCCG